MPSKRAGNARSETDPPADGPPAKDTTKAPSGRNPAKRAPGRTNAQVGRPKTAQESGRYTAPIPRSVRRSSRAFGITILVLLILGVLTVILNYLSVLPGSTSAWYLVGGLGVIFVGSMMATRYR